MHLPHPSSLLPPKFTHCQPRPDVRNILITGGAGFIGSWLAYMFASVYPDSYKIIIFDNLEYCASTKNLAFLAEYKDSASFVKGDIACEEQVFSCLKTHKIDTIFHLAAQTHVDASFTDPYAFTRANVLGTQTLLEACSKVGTVKRFYHMSTDEVYGELMPFARNHVESDPLAPTNPYSATKAAAEMLVQAYAKTYKLQTVILRPNNIFGPCQYPEKIIPKFLMLLKHGQKMTLHRGSGLYSRCYLYVTDAANAMNIIFHRGEEGGIYNISSRDEITNARVCESLFSLVGRQRDGCVWDWIQDVPGRLSHDRAYGVDSSRLESLGWKQEVEFDKGLGATASWYMRFGEDWWTGLGAKDI
ncbi:uncharacterized protein DSM5745_09339 [Aspergillus mulundensis]|uniref:NAD(P)-binding domain-containing protein n=1 Tax=Aspergillus mulundensis TaxID=1810919 RepID=A0A3D8R088_9EURO|nr:hypothetical protein DSM5745_09339 [Aspergillus mulundensis]RDW67473.1 hypothetical protein DSM5745_09339 [Aspergillus mulundensis]